MPHPGTESPVRVLAALTSVGGSWKGSAPLPGPPPHPQEPYLVSEQLEI